MKEELINFETAKLAKEKGFGFSIDIITAYSFNKEGKSKIKSCNNTEEDYYCQPTQSLLQKWLREEHKLVVFVDFAYGDYGKYSATLLTEGKNKKYIHKVDGFTIYYTYEQALEQGLQEALKLIK